MTDNTEQKEFWNDLKGDLWVELQTKIDPMLAVFDEKLLEVLDVLKGERALEIGCGTQIGSCQGDSSSWNDRLQNTDPQNVLRLDGLRATDPLRPKVR